MNTKAAGFVLLTVSDIGESVAFYRDTLGLDLETVDEESGWAELVLPPTTLALGEENPQFPMSPGAPVSRSHLPLMTSTRPPMNSATRAARS